jgi:hypothetical protein
MIQTVEKRKVSRWFYRGKGFHTETAAIRFIAEAELRAEMYRRANQLAKLNPPAIPETDDSGDDLKPYILQAYAEKFQHTPGYCDRYRHPSTVRPCRTSATYNTMFEVVGRTFDYSVCRVAKAEYLEKRVAELRAAGVVKVKQ